MRPGNLLRGSPIANMSEGYTRAAGDTLDVLTELRPSQLQIVRPPVDEPMIAINGALPTEAPPVGSPGLRLAGAITGGVGVASLIGGGYYALRVSTLSEESRNAAVFDPGRKDDLDAANTRQYVFLTAGAVALAVGVILYYLGTK